MAAAFKLDTPPATAYLGDDLMTAEEVETWLKMAPGWVKEQTRERTKKRCKNPLPHVKLGKYSRFSRRRIAEWVEENSA